MNEYLYAIAAASSGAAIPLFFLWLERKKSAALGELVKVAEQQVKLHAERSVRAERLALAAERRAVEVADDRNVELVRARQRLADALMWLGEMEDAEKHGRARAALVAKERMAKAIGAAPASQRRAKAAS